ncbi:hypothetical protein [Streptomyces sp. T028]|uniref:hypothetical protein n=1 Tax=Streptomyces sp. T028 TaxID=3394379 RepID=UPI003A85DD60
MNFDALYHANFKLLDDAVTDWSTLVRNLEQLKKDAEDELHQAANKANWAGMNQQVSKEFIGKTAGEFADAHTQADTIHKILSDTLGELKGYHQQLITAVKNGTKKSLTVFPSGDGFTVTSSIPPQVRGEDAPDQTADITALRDEIQGILDKATESDSSASTILKAIADQSKMGFSDAKYKDRDSAAEAIKKADELAKLAKKDPNELTVKEFDLLTAGLKKYGNDPLFAERFATDLGPKKTLEFWTGVTDPRNYDIGSERRDKLDDLQRGLSLTLASASQSDSAAMADWKRNVIDLGGTRIGRDGTGPMGFQVMSNLMRVGDYDDKFMVDYGTSLMAKEKELTGYGQLPNRAWQFGGAGGADQYLNRIGGDSGADPLTGYLRGLSNSPAAATDFFNQEYVSKDNPDNPFERDSDDANSYKGKVTLSNFQYLFEEREWPQETGIDGDELHTGQNNLAMALEAATTGHPAGEMPTVDTPPHNSDQAKLFEAIVTSVADDDGRLTDNSYMSDSMGQIASEYLPDINRSVSDVKRDTDSPDWRDIEKLYPVAGAEAKLGHTDVSRFLFSVGQNPEGYAAVEVGQKAYLGKLIDYHLNPDLPDDLRVSSNSELLVTRISENSGEVSGTVRAGMQESIGDEASNKDKGFEQAVAQKKNLIGGGVGTVVGVGTSFVATPWVGAAVGGAAGTATSVVLESVFQDAEGHAAEEAQKAGGQVWQEGQERNVQITQEAVRAAAEKYHLNGTDLSLTAGPAARQGYINAKGVLEGQAPGITTGS